MKSFGRAGFACLLASLALLFPSHAFSAIFGVDQGAPPHGFLILIGDNAIQAGMQPYLGDIPHKMTLYIEVAPADTLVIDLYDPGLYNPARLNWTHLDGSFDTTAIGEMRYTLISPALNNLRSLTYIEDAGTDNRQTVNFYNSAVHTFEGPGTYQLVCELTNKIAGTTQDVSVFGVLIPGKKVYSYNLSVGYNDMVVGPRASGAAITDPITLYPWVAQTDSGLSDPENNTGFQVSGLDFVNLDMDAAVHGTPPPSLNLTTRRGATFTPPPAPSANGSFWVDHTVGPPVGELDCDDQGIWRWDFTDVSAVDDLPSPGIPTPFPLNVFSMQVTDYGHPNWDWQYNNWPYLPSWEFPIEERNPRRIYLPMDDGSAPQKEEMGHTARIAGGQNPITETLTTTLEVTVRIVNPNTYALTLNSGTTYVAPFAYYTNPAVTGTSANVTAVVNGTDPKRIDIGGSIPAGGQETFTYTLDVTPPTQGTYLLNGDGDDFVGKPGRETMAFYTSPVTLLYGDDQIGPVPSLYFTAVDLVCSAEARLTPGRVDVCPNEIISFDGSGSTVTNCRGGNIQYRWLINGFELFPWSDTQSSVSGPAAASGTVTLEVRCSSETTCTDSIDAPVNVFPAPAPVIDPAAPQFCRSHTATLTLTNASAYTSYRWNSNPAGHSGDTATTPSILVNDGDFNVDYTVTALTPDGCTVTGTVRVTERVVTPVITPASPVEVCPGQTVHLEVAIAYTSYLWSTNPPGAAGDGSTAAFVDTGDANVRYTVSVVALDGCQGSAYVDTVPAADTLPPALGNVLFATRNGIDVVMRWTDLGAQVQEYWIAHLDADSDLDGDKDTNPDSASLDGAADFMVQPAIETYTDAGGVNRPSFLVYYNVRATSFCYGTPGVF